MTLFVVAAPVSAESAGLIRAFQALAATRDSVEQARVLEVARGMLGSFQAALFLALSVLVAASVATWRRIGIVPASYSSTATGSRLWSGSWILLSGITATGIATVLLLFVAGAASYVMEAAEDFAGARTAEHWRLTPSQYADAISTRLIVGTIGGGTLAILCGLLGAIGVLSGGRLRRTQLTDTLSWPTMIVVGLLLSVGLVRVTLTLRGFGGG
jgi:4-hydroxybenzoate polyprenyltransferase